MLIGAVIVLMGILVLGETKDTAAYGYTGSTRRIGNDRHANPVLFWVDIVISYLAGAALLVVGLAVAAYSIHEARIQTFRWAQFLWFDLGWVVGAAACFFALVFGLMATLVLRNPLRR